MKNRYWNWVKDTTLPEKETEIMMAIPSLEGDAWVYILGCYYQKGAVFTIDGYETEVDKPGYYFYSARYRRLLPIETIKYWTYIETPAAIEDELIITRNDPL